MLHNSVSFCSFLLLLVCSFREGLSLFLPKNGIPEVRTIRLVQKGDKSQKRGEKAGLGLFYLRINIVNSVISARFVRNNR